MAAGFGLLRLSPDAFWAMTPRELRAAFSVFVGPVRSPPTRDDLRHLMQSFPDLRPTDGAAI